MDTAGKAVLFSGVTVLISLSAVMLVPSPAFRSMSLGIMLVGAVRAAAALTLLPALLAKLGDRIDALSLKWVHAGEHRSPAFARWAELLWRRPWLFGTASVAVLVALALPVFGLDTGMPSIKVVPQSDGSRVGYEQVQAAFGPGAPGTLQIVSPAVRGSRRAGGGHGRPRHRRRLLDARLAGARRSCSAQPTVDPSDPALATTIDRLRDTLPADALVGGVAAENHDLEQALAAKTIRGARRRARARVPAAAGRPAGTADRGRSAWRRTCSRPAPRSASPGSIFQDGHGSGLLGFESQGFLDAWAPVFFFAMIFAISMDYTVFLLSSAKEHWDRSHDAHEAMIGGVAHSGRAIFAAGGGDGGGVLHLRALRPAAAEGDGRHPRRRRAARRDADPARADAGAAAPARPGRLGAAALARPHPPGRPLRALDGVGLGCDRGRSPQQAA